MPSQTAPEQAQEELGGECQTALETIASRFRGQENRVEAMKVFTHDPVETVNRVALEEDVDAVLIPGRAEMLTRLLVAVKDHAPLPRATRVAATLSREGLERVTLVHVAGPGEEERAKNLLDRTSASLTGNGCPIDIVGTRAVQAEDVRGAILEAAEGPDAIVMGETSPSVREKVLGGMAQRVAKKAKRPVIVVRDEHLEEGDWNGKAEGKGGGDGDGSDGDGRDGDGRDGDGDGGGGD